MLSAKWLALTRDAAVLVPDSRPSEKAIFSHYGKAIGSLQAAVNDPKARFNPEVLCATALIALFEVDPP